MAKRSMILAASAILIVSISVWLALAWTAEPSADGHSLSYWLDMIDKPHRHAYPHSDQELKQAALGVAALQKMGARAVPSLLSMMHATNSPLRTNLFALAARQHLINFHLLNADDMNYQAMHGFGALGSNACSAVPRLVEIYEQNGSGMSRKCSAYSLVGIGPAAAAAVPALLRVATNTNSSAKSWFYEDRSDAIMVLGEIHSSPQTVVPTLTNCLTDSSVCTDAETALGKFGKDATSALPLLFNLLSDSNKMVRLNAVEAIKKISPAEAERRKMELEAVAGPPR
jgi:hypothetical protein